MLKDTFKGRTNYYICSKCNHPIDSVWNFCPNCNKSTKSKTTKLEKETKGE